MENGRIALAAAVVALAMAVALTVRDARPPRASDPSAGVETEPLASDTAPAAPRPDRITVGHTLGSPDATVRVVEVSDFGCPYCGEFARDTYRVLHDEYVATGRVRWTFIPFVAGIYPNGAEAALAAECAGLQGDDAFWRLHDGLFADQARWTGARDPGDLFVDMARDAGLDARRLERCYRDREAQSRVWAANALVEPMGVRATPTFFVGDTRIQGALPLARFRDVLDDALAGR